MRQAGRYLPEYRELRGDRDILETIRTPEQAVEVTLQPLRRMPVDAAILFSDIVVPLVAVGVPIRIEAGRGPVLDDPFRGDADLARLRPLEPEADEPYVLETVRLLAKELQVPLIGFAGAPFTLASYLIEGGPSRDHARTKALLWSEPAVWDRLLAALVDIVVPHLRAQVAAGASALQVFDSWVGALAPGTYRARVQPHMRRLFDGLADLDVPTIHFGVGTGELLGAMAEAGGDADRHRRAGSAGRRMGSDRRSGRPRGAGKPGPDGAVVDLGCGRGWGARRARARRRPRWAHLQSGPRRAADHAGRPPAAVGRPRARAHGAMSGRVAVIGGGVSGLTAAYRLSAAGIDATVLEAGATTGGKLRSVEVGGLRLPAGPDSFLARKPWAVELCRELGFGDELIAPRGSGAFLWTAAGLVPYPTGTAFGIPGDLGDVFRWPGVSRRGRRRALLDFVKPKRRVDADESLGSLLRRRLGDEATDRAIGPLLGGLYARRRRPAVGARDVPGAAEVGGVAGLAASRARRPRPATDGAASAVRCSSSLVRGSSD